MRILLWVAVVITAASVWSDAARAEKRVALVIGNAAYTGVTRLRNPVNDATDLTTALKQLGFEVLGGTDLDQAAMRTEIRKFSAALSGADVGLFFFAGHGLEVSNQNFLIPVDAAIEAEADLDFQAVPLDLVFRQMTREAKTTLIFLDACRDNPMAAKLARSMGARSVAVGRGLARVESGLGSYIAFATEPGKIALDGAGRNSPFTAALLKHIAAEGRDISSMMIAVRNEVLKETGGKQLPWDHSALTGQFFFKAAAPVISAPAPNPEPSLDFSALTERLKRLEALLADKSGQKPEAAPAQPADSAPAPASIPVAKDPAPAPSVPQAAQVNIPPAQQDIAAIGPHAAPDAPQGEPKRPADEAEHAAIAPDMAPVAEPEVAGAPITQCDELVKIDDARLTEAIVGNNSVDLSKLWIIAGGSPSDAASECERAAEQYPDEKRFKLRLAIAYKNYTYADARQAEAAVGYIDNSRDRIVDPASVEKGDSILKSLASEGYPEAALLTGGARLGNLPSAPMNADGLIMLAGARDGDDLPMFQIRQIILLKSAEKLGAAAAGKIIAAIEQRASDNTALRSALDSAARRVEIEAKSQARTAVNPAAECERLTQFDLMVDVGLRLSGVRFGVDRSLAIAACNAAPVSHRWRLTKALIANGEIGKAKELLSPAFKSNSNGLTKEVLNQLAQEAQTATDPETLFQIPFVLALEAADRIAAGPTEELVSALTTGLLILSRAAELGHLRAQAIIAIAGPYAREIVKHQQDLADGKAAADSKAGGWSEVQNQYQRRAELIPNLVETVKVFAAQEKEVLTEVVEARARATQVQLPADILSNPDAMQKFEDAQNQLSGALARMLVAVDRYPDLKSNQNFLALQAQLEGTENRIAVARRDYTQAVQQNNTELRSRPDFSSGIDMDGVRIAAAKGDTLAILALAAFHLVPDVVQIDANADPIRIFSAEPNSPAKNSEEAVRLVRSAADKGDTIAMVTLGLGYLIGDPDIPKEIVPQWPLKADPAEGIRWLERAVDGEPLAALALLLLFQGRLVPESAGVSDDPEKARHWESRLVEAGLAFW